MRNAIKYISQILLKPGENLVVLFSEGNKAPIGEIGVPLGRAFFFKVSVETELLRRYQLFAQLEAQHGVDYDYLGDGAGLAVVPPLTHVVGHGAGTDILRINDDDWWVYHFGYSPLQDNLRIYKRLQAEIGITGFEYVTPDLPNPVVGSPYGYIKGREVMNYYDPPVKTETLMFRNDRHGQLWQFGLFNESIDTETGQMDPCMLIVGKAYRLLPIVRKDIMMKMLHGEIPRHMYTFGGLQNMREETYLPHEWKTAKNELYVTFADITGVPAPIMRAATATKGRV